MGKKAKSARHAKRMLAKRAARAQRRARYEALRGTGNSKRSRQRSAGSPATTVHPASMLMLVPVIIKGKPALAMRRVHGGPACRNIGCKRCSSVYATLRRMK